MRDCSLFRRSLLDSLPHSVRHSVQHTINAFDSSEAVLRLLNNALNHDTPHNGSTEVCVAAIGSFGRLDGQPHLSDVDAIYLYAGAVRQAQVKKVRIYIQQFVANNKAFLFDHREDIESGKFDFEKSPAYPIMSPFEFRDANHQIRCVQLLTESRIVSGKSTFDTLRSDILQSYGYSTQATSLDLSSLRKALASFRDAYCGAVINRKPNSHWKLTNRKILKLFALREFSYLANLFAIADISLSVALADVDRPPNAILSAPSILKIAAWGSSNGVFGRLIRRLGPHHSAQVLKLLENSIPQLREIDRALFETQDADVGDSEVFRCLRRFTIPILMRHDALLSYLHDPEFLAQFDAYNPDITTWISQQPYTTIVSKRNQMIESIKCLASQIQKVLAIAENHGILTSQADEALAEIIAYKMKG